MIFVRKGTVYKIMLCFLVIAVMTACSSAENSIPNTNDYIIAEIPAATPKLETPSSEIPARQQAAQQPPENTYPSETFENIDEALSDAAEDLTVAPRDGIITAAGSNHLNFVEGDQLGGGLLSTQFVTQFISLQSTDSTFSNDITTVIGTGGRGHVDGGLLTAQLALPYGVTADAAGNILVFDTYSGAIRSVSHGTATTLTGGTNTTDDNGFARGYYSDAPLSEALLGRPTGGVFNSQGELFFADSQNHVIRHIKGGAVYTFSGTVQGFSDGERDEAQFNNPMAIAIDLHDNIYAADTLNNSIRKIDPTGKVTTVAEGLSEPAGIAVSDDGSIIYVADTGSHSIKKIENGVMTAISGGISGFADGSSQTSRFNFPRGLALAGGSILVADSGNHAIREITNSGQVITVAGSGYPGDAYSRAGDALNNPSGLHYYNGELYIADTANNKIKKIDFTPESTNTTYIQSVPSSRFISIFASDGNVTMARGTDRTFTAVVGTQLFDGYTVATGENSYCHLLLDDGSLLKMDQRSKVNISRTWSNRLSVTVLSGGLLVEAATQQPDNTVETRVGNSVIAIRGTMFIAEHMPGGNVAFTMFEGAGEAGGIMLYSGYTVNVFDTNTISRKHELRKIIFDEDSSRFMLETVLSDVERFVNNGTINQSDVPKLENILEEKEQADNATKPPAPTLAEQGRVIYSNLLADMGSGGNNTNSENAAADRLLLQTVLRSSHELRVDVRVSADGSDIESDKDWVTREIMDTLDYAMTEAEIVLITPVATHLQVRGALNDLNGAVDIFRRSISHGTLPVPIDPILLEMALANSYAAKIGVLTNTSADNVDFDKPWTTSHVITGFEAALVVAENAFYAALGVELDIDVVKSASAMEEASEVFYENIQRGSRDTFLDTGEVTAGLKEAYKAKTGITVNTDSANVPQDRMWVTISAMNELNTAIKETENALNAFNDKEITDEESNEAICAAVVAEADKLNAAVNAFISSKNSGQRPVSIDTAALRQAIISAHKTKSTVGISNNGRDIFFGEWWVTLAEFHAFNDAIITASNALNTIRTAPEVNDAVTLIEVAETAFLNAKKQGAKSADLTVLAFAIQRTELELNRIGEDFIISDNALQVSSEQRWVTQAAADALDTALEQAFICLAVIESQSNTEQFTVISAASTLNTATSRFLSSARWGYREPLIPEADEQHVWHNITTNKTYALSHNAIYDARDGDVIELIADAEISDLTTLTARAHIIINDGATLTIGSNGELNLPGVFYNVESSLTNNGTLVIESGGNCAGLDGTAIINNGLIENSGELYCWGRFENNGKMHNKFGALLDIRQGTAIFTGTEDFVNDGRFFVGWWFGGASVFEFIGTGSFINNGQFEVQDGSSFSSWDGQGSTFIYASPVNTIVNNGTIIFSEHTNIQTEPHIMFVSCGYARIIVAKASDRFVVSPGIMRNISWDMSNFLDALPAGELPVGTYTWDSQYNAWIAG